jgi:hypothetical protein
MYPSFKKISEAVNQPQVYDKAHYAISKFDYGPTLIVEEKSDVVASPQPDRGRRNMSDVSRTLNYIRSESPMSV